jgi:ubiquinone biosynthesis monooxygenase Coq6
VREKKRRGWGAKTAARVSARARVWDCLCVAAGNWGWDYDQRGVVATVRTTGGMGHQTAWQRFLPDGPVAILPLWDDLSSVVWSTTPAHAAELVSLSGPEFVTRLNAALTAPTSAFTRPPAPREDAAHAQRPGSSSGGSDGGPHKLYDRQSDVISLDPLALTVRAGNALASAIAEALESARPRRAGTAAASPQQQPPHVTATIGQRASFPLRLSKSNADVQHRLALIGYAMGARGRGGGGRGRGSAMRASSCAVALAGRRSAVHGPPPPRSACSDAAHSMHPLAGQGLNLGIAEASALVDALSEAADTGADPGSLSVLRDYGRRRYAEGTGTVLAMDAIRRAFSLPAGADPSHAVWVPLRSIGMAALNSLEPVKSLLVHVATGAWRR